MGAAETGDTFSGLQGGKVLITSENIADLSAALAKAQRAIKGAIKDSSNPFFKNKYADLSSVWEACRLPLTENGLSVVQTSDFLIDQPDYVVIETQLNHSSGQWIRGKIAMKPVKSDPQGIGSCITYARRYSLAAIIGIAPEDDDGNAASGNTGKPSNSAAIERWKVAISDMVGNVEIADYRGWWEPRKDAIIRDCGDAGAAEVYKHWLSGGKRMAAAGSAS